MSTPVLVKEQEKSDPLLEFLTPVPVDTSKRKILANQIENITKTIGTLRQIERDARTQLEAKRSDLKSQLTGTKYQQLSLEALKRRNDVGLPVFALFALTSPIFTIESQNMGDSFGKYHPAQSLPTTLAQCYADVREKLTPFDTDGVRVFSVLIAAIAALIAIDGKSFEAILGGSIVAMLAGAFAFFAPATKAVRITARYDGIMPIRVREKIAQVEESKEFDQIFILAEVKEWQKDEVVIPKKDPLVLGFVNNNLFLIDKYDTTGVEEYVANEFATSV